MPHHYSDSSIPTLTDRVEPGLGSPQAPAAIPRLSEQASAPPVSHESGAASAPDTPFQPGDAVLRAVLQAELEETLTAAIDEAVAGIRARLDAELPAILVRVMRNVRPG
ncbi:hypothetical protein [Bordetella bronchiseptica]|uniref:hypothetical protein n=1 Tax=Bordetella bronchiseptica TaxID=518 RepID=UPI0012457D93|nr:hypothetical protein [Bordetella bronchiseptica]KAB1449523.1 hypothetical protein F7D00_06130 [Bordetella bronchiseptica]KAB1575453.1 hypothetical protein F7890_06130 [Bordetella bronchiseptica]